MKSIPFVKMVGAGNDFVVMDNRQGLLSAPLSKQAKNLCDRKFSIGADGLITLEKSKSADIRMRIFNPDGSEAEMCGNGVRCLAKFASALKITDHKLSIETLAGIIEAEVKGNVVKAKMIEPKDLRLKFSVRVNGADHQLHFINTGVPHTVKILKSVQGFDVGATGEAIRHHRHFAPRGTNVNFVALKSGNHIDIRTYERGVEDETLACGTGSTAGALVAAALQNLKSPVFVHTHGGETLKVYFSKKNQSFYDVYLEGNIETSFEGRVKL